MDNFIDHRSLNTLGTLGNTGNDATFSLALNDFRRARNRAAMHAILSRLQGTSLELLSYSEVVDSLRFTGQVDRGVREIPVEKIIGSVGRYQDFDRSFLPLNKSDAQRWAGLRAAAPDLTTLPPIDVYQVGDAYFVVDGNHRVSIARLTGADYLAAHVIQIQTRVPLPADLDHGELILAAEKAAFLEHTHLDKLRPTAVLETSLIGQYDRLENHIEVHRFFIEMREERALTDEEATLRWYDEAYMPVVEAIREYGLLRGFPGRTETDLYLWIAENQSALANQLGWEVSPQAAATQIASQFEPAPKALLGRLYRKVMHAVQPERKLATEATWLQQKTLDRYSDRLFASILAIVDEERRGSAVAHAAGLAHLEQAHLLAVQLGSGDPDALPKAREWFANAVQGARVSGDIGLADGDLKAIVQRRLRLTDLVVIDRRLLLHNSDSRSLIEEGSRPVLLVSGAPEQVRRVLFVYDGRPEAQEALFVVAYMAEMWKCQLVMLAGTDTGAAVLDRARDYLDLHETRTEAVVAQPLSPASIFETAVAQHCDLIVVGGYRKAPLSKSSLAAWLAADLADLTRPLLICP